MVEQGPFKPLVAGSTPAQRTKNISIRTTGIFFYSKSSQEKNTIKNKGPRHAARRTEVLAARPRSRLVGSYSPLQLIMTSLPTMSAPGMMRSMNQLFSSRARMPPMSRVSMMEPEPPSYAYAHESMSTEKGSSSPGSRTKEK